VCTFAFCRGPGEDPIIFQGRTEVFSNCFQSLHKHLTDIQGAIVRPRGPTNFGK
jgi:inosine triphosphate pyrophosphatase